LDDPPSPAKAEAKQGAKLSAVVQGDQSPYLCNHNLGPLFVQSINRIQHVDQILNMGIASPRRSPSMPKASLIKTKEILL